jgi:transcriptional regulator GlxA family with amidase domain
VKILFVLILYCLVVSQEKKFLNVGFLVVDGVYNSELIAPFDIFHHTKFRSVELPMKPFIVAASKKMVTSFEGIRFYPDYDFKTCPEIDILVVPSAEFSMSKDLENVELIDFVRERGKKAKYVLSLCDGSFVLAQAGLLDNKKCTTFPSDVDKFRKKFPNLDIVDQVSFVRDGKMITSVGGAKSYDPAIYLVDLFYGKEAAIKTAEGLVIDYNLDKIKTIIIND